MPVILEGSDDASRNASTAVETGEPDLLHEKLAKSLRETFLRNLLQTNLRTVAREVVSAETRAIRATSDLLSESEVVDPIVDGGGRGAYRALSRSDGGGPVTGGRRKRACVDGERRLAVRSTGEEGGEGEEGIGEDVRCHGRCEVGMR